ncbi:MAG: hypothetical protein R3C45_13850 [Phycisphaerales bacterium]
MGLPRSARRSVGREEGYQSFIDHDAATVQMVYNLYEQPSPGRAFYEIAPLRGKGGVIARVPTNSGILDEEFKALTMPPTGTTVSSATATGSSMA